MKKLIIHLVILLMVISIPSFAQDKTEKPKEPIKPALLVIDIQKAFMPMMSSDKEIALEYINALIDLFRKHGYPVIRVYHTSEEYGVTPGTEGFEYPETVKILPTDPKVLKTYSGGNSTPPPSTYALQGGYKGGLRKIFLHCHCEPFIRH